MKIINLGGGYCLTFTSDTDWTVRNVFGELDHEGYIKKLAETLIAMRESVDASVQ